MTTKSKQLTHIRILMYIHLSFFNDGLLYII